MIGVFFFDIKLLSGMVVNNFLGCTTAAALLTVVGIFNFDYLITGLVALEDDYFLMARFKLLRLALIELLLLTGSL